MGARLIVLILILFSAGCTTPTVPTMPPQPSSTPTPTDVPTFTPLPATETVAPSPTPDDLVEREVILPQNADALTEVGVIRESGATLFTWMGEDGKVAIGSDGQIGIYNITPALLAEEIQGASPSILVSSPDQMTLAWASMDNVVRLIQLEHPDETLPLEQPGGPVTSLAFSPLGDSLAASTSDNSIFLWNVQTGLLETEMELPYFIQDLSFSPDGSLLAGVAPQEFTVHFLDVTSGEEVSNLSWEDHASPVLYQAAFSPNWSTIAWVARGTVQLMDVETGSLGHVLGHEDFINADIAWSPDGTLLATASASTVDDDFAPVVIIWDVESGNPLTTLVHDEPVVDISFSPDGRELASLNAMGSLRVWAVEPTS